MESKEMWEQLIMERVVEILKPSLPVEAELEEAQEQFWEILDEEQKKKYEELRDKQIGQVISDQNMIYQQGLFDGLYFGHKIFVDN